MPRKGPVPKREILPDPRYKSKLVAKFINGVMRDGKKSVAEKIVYKAMEELAKNTSDEPLTAFEKALNNVKPEVEVKPRSRWGHLSGSSGSYSPQAAHFGN